MCVSSELPVTVEKTAGTIYRAPGRERPHELFGRLKAEKVGSLPPVSVVCRPLLLKFLFRKFLSLRVFGGDRVKTLVQTTLKSEILTFFTKKA
jgi:hypothetical protein